MYAMNIGAVIPSMTVKFLNTMYIVIPSEELLEQYDGVAQSFFNKRKMYRIPAKYILGDW